MSIGKRLGTSYLQPRARTNAGWWTSKNHDLFFRHFYKTDLGHNWKLLLPHKPKRELLLHRLPFDMIGSGMCFDHHHDHC